MLKKIRPKVFIGFVLLIAILLASTGVLIFEYSKINNSYFMEIENRGKIILSATKMVEAIDIKSSVIMNLRDSSIFSLNNQIAFSDSIFRSDLAKIKAIKKIDNKNTLDIEKNYNILEEKIKKPMKNDSSLIYQKEITSSFINIKKSLNKLIAETQEENNSSINNLQGEIHRALMPNLISVISATIFAIILYFFILTYLLLPITNLLNAVNNYHEDDRAIDTDIKSDDEIKKLEISINNLIDILTKKNKNGF